MIIGYSMLVMSFVYLTVMSISYYSKKRIKNSENKLYNILIIVTFMGIFLETSCIYMVPIRDMHPVLNELANRSYLLYILAWVFLFTKYILIISIDNKKKISIKIKENIKKVNSLMIFAFVACSATLIFLPLYYHYDGVYTYSYGPATTALFIHIAIAIAIWLLSLFINLKTVGYKKYIPLFVFILGVTLNMIIRIYNPGVLLITVTQVLITVVMYFTIENPDVQMIEQLNIARDRADKANNAKTEFLSSMSHEIRTPLNAIDGFSQLILEEDNIDTIKEEAKDIMAASQNLLEIVNGILDISKIEADKLEIVNVEYEPTKIFEEVGKLAKSRIGEKPVEFKMHIAEDLPDYLNGDYTRIKQITLNLLTNAVKYTKNGYVDFSVRCVTQDHICRLIIMVKDTGIGIKKENVDKLFEKFERFDKEQNITIEGTGLGLAITKKLVNLMNGRIIADSRYGTGSIFAVVLDQKIVNKKKEVDVEVVSNKSIFTNANILIVDDNKINLKVASRLLESYKVKTETMDSGFKCIEKIKSGYKYDLILMDDMMPKISGTETLKELKKISNFNTPVVALTANAIAGMKEKYLSDGFDDYISKPIDKKELERVLNKHLN